MNRLLSSFLLLASTIVIQASNATLLPVQTYTNRICCSGVWATIYGQTPIDGVKGGSLEFLAQTPANKLQFAADLRTELRIPNHGPTRQFIKNIFKYANADVDSETRLSLASEMDGSVSGIPGHSEDEKAQLHNLCLLPVTVNGAKFLIALSPIDLLYMLNEEKLAEQLAEQEIRANTPLWRLCFASCLNPRSHS